MIVQEVFGIVNEKYGWQIRSEAEAASMEEETTDRIGRNQPG